MPQRFAFSSILLPASLATSTGEIPIDLDTPTGALSGTLTLPDKRSKAPVMLIVSGSGPTDRDGNTPFSAGKNDSLKLLARALADSGIPSVRYDKRGVGRSASAANAEADLRFDDYVLDAECWVTKLSVDTRFPGVGIIGHSEGATIGLAAAAQSQLSAYVSIAGPAKRASNVIRRQLAGKLPLQLAERSEAILTSLEQGKTVDEIPAELMMLYRPSVQPYLISWFRYVPTVEIAKLPAPCLIIQGDTDIQVDIADAEALMAARSICEFHIIPGMNHVLKIVPADRAQQISSYGNPSLPIAPELIQHITAFISRLSSSPVRGS